jgi:hypothetical protein
VRANFARADQRRARPANQRSVKLFNAAEGITFTFRSNILAGPPPRERLPLAARSINTNKHTGLYSVLRRSWCGGPLGLSAKSCPHSTSRCILTYNSVHRLRLDWYLRECRSALRIIRCLDGRDAAFCLETILTSQQFRERSAADSYLCPPEHRTEEMNFSCKVSL